MNRILFFSIISFLFISGCANNGNKFEQLSSDVQNLNEKVDQINNEINGIRTDIQNTKEEANRANQRLDNQASSYKK
ncbi:LPP leucine zipper domain-containing protein [bacterium endosymbiont of Pedicinus badii]|uniref:LPP leucine zipper domain-containing protein n=1 Tax=bacterium endosymbiont of Pedicinus badii TaxID=1719126 RepID=UPI0009BAB0C3|nr:LPP leucine zipper domain-containing protein [bacterium endosymbiont of Pedicinus badii]OQM34395.1 murein lipoprotein [bacterium endosymbiont of Pedicinus badii]